MYQTPHGTKAVVFDLDDTLAPSKSPLDPSMATALVSLLQRLPVCIISGGRFEQFQAQVLDRLTAPEQILSGLHLTPTCGQPQAFLMDEPLSNLDAKLRVGMRASLAELHERLHVTTVYVTHDQVEAMTLGHRVCVLLDGMLQQVDTPQNLYDHPVNLSVGGFIGSPSMNIVKAGVISGDDGMAVTFAGFRLPIPEEVVRASSGIEAYVGRDVILGIRPSDFEDSSLTDDSWPKMPVVTHVTEALGSDINVIFAIDAPPVEHKDLADLLPEQEEEGEAIPLYEGKSLWTARVNARSPVRAGDRIELGVDTRNLHFFDPESGLAIGGAKIAASPSATSKQQSRDPEVGTLFLACARRPEGTACPVRRPYPPPIRRATPA